MNEEQNTPEDLESGEVASEESSTTDTASQAVSDSNNATSQDDYYAVDHAKKDVVSTIGDGEMHNEGLVGEGDIPADIQTSTDRLSDEQDQAEFHDSEG